jgi:hypothetical protein
MSLAEIQRAVNGLSPDERRRLTVWMVAHHPVLRVEQLMAHASRLVADGSWMPTPPSDDNQPTANILEHGLRVAGELGLGK